MKDTVACFILGHAESVTAEHFVIRKNHGKNRVTKDIDYSCSRCGTWIETVGNVRGGDTHYAKVLSRENIVDGSRIYYASCWCGWDGPEHINYVEASTDFHQHARESLLVEDAHLP